VNPVSLKTLLTGVMMYIMDNPGITRDSLLQKYARYIQPVSLFELIEVMYGVVRKNVALYFCPYLCQLFTNFQNASTLTFCGQFAIM